jgi:hypothetical protein
MIVYTFRTGEEFHGGVCETFSIMPIDGKWTVRVVALDFGKHDIFIRNEGLWTFSDAGHVIQQIDLDEKNASTS